MEHASTTASMELQNGSQSTAGSTVNTAATTTQAGTSSSTSPQLNPDQQAALTDLLAFIVDPNPASLLYVLSGYAGTGKTFLMREVVARTKRSRLVFAFTAPTNKAAKVLRGITGEACTIFSLLGLRIEKNGELKELVGGEAPLDLSDIDIIVLDEASMVNRRLFALLEETAKRYNIKIILMGDKGQLPPVGEAESPVWALQNRSTLHKVMRYDNQILKLVTSVRDQIDSLAPCINIRSDNDGKEGVWKLTKLAFKEAVYNAAANGEFADSSRAKVIAWRNVRTDEYNDLIRRAIFGGRSVTDRYIIGDRVIATAPCKRGDDVLLATDDEAIVEDVVVTVHPFQPEYKCYELKCRTELGKTIRLIVPHPLSEAKWDDDCQQLAFAAKANKKLWKKFWELKDCFHEIKYGYAITAHRAQGSTYETVFVDYQDVLLNRNRKEAFQCLYVACSRPTSRLLLA